MGDERMDSERIASLVSERLTQTLPEALPKGVHIQMPRLRLRLTQSTGAGPEALADRIVRGVIGALKSGGLKTGSLKT